MAADPAPRQCRLLIDSRCVGGLIGKDGQNMKELQSTSGVVCSIRKAADETATERVMLVRGSLDELDKGLLLIARSIQNATAPRDQPSNPDRTISIKLLVDRSQIGGIIGKDGANVKTLRSETSATINIASEPLADSTEQAVTVAGVPTVVHAALVRLVKQVLDNPPRTPTIEYNPGAAPRFDLAAAAGQVPAAALPPHLQSALAAWLLGSSQPAAGARQGRGAASAAAAPARGGKREASTGRPARQAAAAVDESNFIERKFLVPNSACGTIIGRAGVNLKRVRTESGAQITLKAAEAANPGQRMIIIKGTEEMVDNAAARIQELVNQAADEEGPRDNEESTE